MLGDEQLNLANTSPGFRQERGALRGFFPGTLFHGDTERPCEYVLYADGYIALVDGLHADGSRKTRHRAQVRTYSIGRAALVWIGHECWLLRPERLEEATPADERDLRCPHYD